VNNTRNCLRGPKFHCHCQTRRTALRLSVASRSAPRSPAHRLRVHSYCPLKRGKIICLALFEVVGVLMLGLLMDELQVCIKTSKRRA